MLKVITIHGLRMLTWFCVHQSRKNTAPEHRPTNFVHPDCDTWEQYPQGFPDIVAYWVKSKLFGEMVLFDREDSGTEIGRLISFKSEGVWKAYSLI